MMSYFVKTQKKIEDYGTGHKKLLVVWSYKKSGKI